MTIRKAKIKDGVKIQKLINIFAQENKVLPRPLGYVYENIRDYWVAEAKGEVVACVALHIIWEDLAEIKSLIVRDDYQRKGVGTKLVEKAIQEAREYSIKKIFLLTYIPGYFLKFGFKPIDKAELPHKIWSECINCSRFPNCDEEAMIKEFK